MFVDAHLHLESFDDVDKVVESAEKERVGFMLTNGVDIKTSIVNLDIARKFKNVYTAVGIHPENLENLSEDYLSILERMAKDKKVVAIGEIGLDYHFRTDNKDFQKQVFIEQLILANKLNLPAIIHSRDAMGDTIDILKQYPLKRESLLHCYGGSIETANELMKLGFSFSFGGVCTFKNAKNSLEVIRELPLERILTETDAPYLTPEPYRGTRNESKYIPIIAKKIAEIKNISIEEVEEQIYKNTKQMFNI